MKLTCCLFVFLLGAVGDVPRPPIVFIGDSITQGWPLWFYEPGSINAGVGGQTSKAMLARFQTDVIDRGPRTVVILAGTNDILRAPAPCIDCIESMSELARRAGARVVIGLIPPNEDWSPPNVITHPVAGRSAINSFNTQLVHMAHAHGYAVVDYYRALTLRSGAQNTALFRDGTHPNQLGYIVMWLALHRVL